MSSRHFRVLVMTDIVDSTARLAEVGDSCWAKLLAQHREELRVTARRRGGQYLGHTGDGVLLSFLSPGAALRCAAELVARAEAQEVPVRVGVHAGEVEEVEDGIGGVAVHAVAALTRCAGASEVLASPAVIPLVLGDDLTFDDVGEHLLKGLSAPWRLWRLCRPSVSEANGSMRPPRVSLPLPHALGVADLPFVGRDVEMRRAEHAWHVVHSGGFASLVVSGEPGVGKTRLVGELCRSAHRERALVLFGRCDEGLRAPYQPLVEALTTLVRDAAPQRIAQLLGPDPGELTRLVPAVRDVVPGARPSVAAGPEAERHRLFTATSGCLAAVAGETPVVLVADDAHWGDAGTLALLRHVVRDALPGLLVVVTLRDTEPETDPELRLLLSEFARGRNNERIALTGWDKDDVAELLVAPAAVAELLTRETAGNPFFVGEVLRDLTARGHAERTGDVWVTSGPFSVDVPPGVREAVRRRVDVLDGRCRSVLTAAAVIGLEADLEIATAVAGTDEASALAAFEAATAAGLLHEVPGGDRWRFSHALVRSALYDDVSDARRRRLHRDVVFAAEDGRMTPAEVAGHALAAGDALEPSVLIRHAGNAAGAARDAAAPADALHWWSVALEALRRDAAAGATLLAELRLRVAEAAVRAGAPEWDTLAEAALRAAVAAGDADLAAEAALVAVNAWWNGSITTRGITPRGARLLEALRLRGAEDPLASGLPGWQPLDVTGVRMQAALAAELMWMPDTLALRDRLSRDALTRARELGDVHALTEATRSRGAAVWCARTARERAALAVEAEQLARIERDPYALMTSAALLGIAGIETAEPELWMRAQAARRDAEEGPEPTVAAYHMGLLDAGRALLTDLSRVPVLVDRLKTTGEAVGHPDAAIFHFFQMQYVALLRGVASEHLDLLVASTGASPEFVGTPALAAALLVLAGRAPEAAPLLEASMALVSGCDNVLEGAALGGLAIVSGLLQHERGAEVALSAMEQVDAACLGSGLVYVGATAHWRGVCLSVLGDSSAAHAALLEGQHVHQRLGSPVGLALSAAELALVVSAEGDREKSALLASQARTAAVASGAGLATVRLESFDL
jgi:hypothetical protein